MDAATKVKAALEPVLDEWVAEIPARFRTVEEFKQLAAELPLIYATGYGAGLDPGAKVVAVLSGTFTGGTPTLKTSTRARGRTRGPSPARSPSRSRGNGHGPSTEQVLIAMREMGGKTSQAQLASRFGVTRQTIAKRLGTLVDDGSVTIEGAGASKTWRAKEFANA